MGNKQAKRNRKQQKSGKRTPGKDNLNSKQTSSNKFYSMDDTFQTQSTPIYKCLETLSSQGLYGKVYKVQMKQTGEILAMKRIEIFEDEKELIKIAEKDYNKLMAINNHRNIVELKDYNMNKKYYEIYTEYFPDGDLRTLLQEDGRLESREGLFIFYQILKGLSGLRDVGIVFKGLKTKNVMCFYKGGKLRLKIGDFGYNKPFGDTRRQKFGKDFNLYSPPEVLDSNLYQEDEVYGNKEDVWSAGCIFFELLFGSHVFDALNKKQLLDLIQAAQSKLWTPPHVEVPPLCIKFIRLCLKAQPKHRPTVSQLITEVKKELERTAFEDFKKSKDKLSQGKQKKNSRSFNKKTGNKGVEVTTPKYPFTLESQEIMPKGKCKIQHPLLVQFFNQISCCRKYSI